jgi:predicted ester cyclase
VDRIEPTASARERLEWRITPERYEQIRSLWIAHSKAEDARDIAGLIDTLSADCVYELVPTGRRWEGHDGARAFYTALLQALPDVRFALRDIVIGPQGVVEFAALEATQAGPWEGFQPVDGRVRVDLVIHFPWHGEAHRFAGERIFFDQRQLRASDG